MSSSSILVHEFGAASVAGADRYRGVARLVLGARHGTEGTAPRAQWVVVAAMPRVTRALHELVALSAQRDEGTAAALAALLAEHRDVAAALLPTDAAARFEDVLARDGRDLADVLRAVWLGRGASEPTEALVSGYGELWSAQLLAAHLAAEGQDATWLDAREVLVLDAAAELDATAERGSRLDWARSEQRLGDWRASHPAELVVVTGFLATTRAGSPTTLRRVLGDPTAAGAGDRRGSGSVFGALLGAEEIVLWTPEDGVLSADPRRVPEAVVLEALSYDEACELAYFGAGILHPRAMEPAAARAIPIRIKNALAPERPGSLIASADRLGARRPVTGFSTFDGVALVNLEGSGMVGVPGVAERLFGALRGAGVSVVLISQGSSEHSICVAVPEAQGGVSREVISRAFAPEIGEGLVHRVELVPGQTILAAVGDGMAHTPGVAAKFFSSLAKAGVSVRAIAQGSSERNISAVVDRADSTRALRAVHAGFVLSDRVLSLGLVGTGLVGKALLAQLAEQAPVLRETLRIDLRLRAVADSKRMVLSETGLSPERALAELAASATPLELDRLAAHVRALHVPHAALIDATASEEVASRYEAWLAQGLHVVTPNKRAGAGPLARYLALRAHEARGRSWLYEATVGAGLPVIATLRDLVRTGDRVTKVEGVLSGTLSYVFNVWDGALPFSQIVRDAKARGYTEPDPRDDLSGMDVARKLVILAREMGVHLELGDVQVESLVPEALRGVDAGAFLDALAQHDEVIEARRARAEAEGAVLRYVGVVRADGRAEVALLPYDKSHPFAALAATDNVIAFSSARYASQPLVVRGPGAGPEVTAGGVFADLLRLVSSLA